MPPAHPTASWLYAPRGVFLGEYRGREVLVAADTGNHRVMIWHSAPDTDETPCDVVLGQLDADSEGPARGDGDTRRGMNLPTGVLIHDDLLIVADAWHHRVLIYRGLPESSGAEPDLILGQDGPDRVEPNRGGGTCAANSFYWPFGVAVEQGRFYVADTGNRRVLGWSGGVPSSPSTEPDLVLGQPDPVSREENRGGDPGPASFRWPHAMCGDSAGLLLVADAGNHRVLGWRPHPDGDRGADLVLGQESFDAGGEFPYAPQTAAMMRFPYAAVMAARPEGGATTLAVADTANNRILLWDGVPADGGPADAVLGQPGFGPNGENRWSGVTRDSLCWPYGLSLHRDRLAVADSGNNRVVIWSRT
ncbi:MAG: NHL repeat-containing protein [Actinobacteria bacterium]|nr:NHL repeat-containing protein [Actinomycetota bacterium]